MDAAQVVGVVGETAVLETQYKAEIVATVGSLKATFKPYVSVVERTEIG